MVLAHICYQLRARGHRWGKDKALYFLAFLAGDFLAVFLAGDFLATGFLAAGFAAAGLAAAGFLAAGFLAAVFLTAVAFFLGAAFFLGDFLGGMPPKPICAQGGHRGQGQTRCTQGPAAGNQQDPPLGACL